MYKNKCTDGRLNICGKKISYLRNRMRTSDNKYVSQASLAQMLQLMNLDVDKNAIQKLEAGTRFVTDIELKALAKLFNVSADYLLNDK